MCACVCVCVCVCVYMCASVYERERWERERVCLKVCVFVWERYKVFEYVPEGVVHMMLHQNVSLIWKNFFTATYHFGVFVSSFISLAYCIYDKTEVTKKHMDVSCTPKSSTLKWRKNSILSKTFWPNVSLSFISLKIWKQINFYIKFDRKRYQ